MGMATIRGAISTENDRESILADTTALLQEMILRNGLQNEDILSVWFTATRDLDAVYPAVAARGLGLTEAGLMCAQEMAVAGSLEKCVRVLATVQTEKKQAGMRHVYMKEAAKLRPDLAREGFSIAIDGPSGAGKSTIAKLLAKRLGFIYVDTGAMYRAVALYGLRAGLDLDSAEAVVGYIGGLDIALRYEDGAQHVFLNGEDVTDAIRTAEAGAGASRAAVYAEVRERLVAMQRQMAAAGGVVMDGRDIGTQVLPNAEVKIYLDASADERARRRCAELEGLHQPADYDTIKGELQKRDAYDMSRALSPLRQADDAVRIDCGGMTPEEAAEAVCAVARGKGLACKEAV